MIHKQIFIGTDIEGNRIYGALCGDDSTGKLLTIDIDSVTCDECKTAFLDKNRDRIIKTLQYEVAVLKGQIARLKDQVNRNEWAIIKPHQPITKY